MSDADARLDALAREDKWYLSGGDGVLWAPACPLWLDRPGFWEVDRGIDDSMHSWVNELLLRGVAGLEPLPGGLRIHPLPVEVQEAEVTGCRLAGHELRLERRGQAWRAEVDGVSSQGRVGAPVEIRW